MEELSEYVVLAETFLNATDWYITGQLKGDVPRTQMTMNMLASGDLEVAQVEMKRVLDAIGQQGDTDAELIDTSQEAWINYARAASDLHASVVVGGSMYPMVWSNQMAELTRARTKSLQWWLERLERLRSL